MKILEHGDHIWVSDSAWPGQQVFVAGKPGTVHLNRNIIRLIQEVSVTCDAQEIKIGEEVMILEREFTIGTSFNGNPRLVEKGQPIIEDQEALSAILHDHK